LHAERGQLELKIKLLSYFFATMTTCLIKKAKTAGAFEAVDWLADLPQRTWLLAGRR